MCLFSHYDKSWRQLSFCMDVHKLQSRDIVLFQDMFYIVVT